MYLDKELPPERLDNKSAILVVEAVETMRRVTADQIRQLGPQKVLMAKDGGDALRILNSQAVHLVLADLDLPVMSGVELLREVRAHDKLSALPFVITTSTPDRARVQEVIESGVTGVLLKPYSSNQLAQRLRNALAWKPRKPEPPPTEALDAAQGDDQALADAEAELALEDDADGGKPTVLLVDDAPDNLLVLSQLLKDEYRITLARNGTKALALCCSDRPPDLVLLDIMMPDIDGFEVAERMRAHPRAETIPVMFVTANTSAEARDRSLALGAVDFITKPIDPLQLKPKVRNFMRHFQLRRDQQADFDRMVEAAQASKPTASVGQADVRVRLAGVLDLLQSVLDSSSLAPQTQQTLQQAQGLALQARDLLDR